MKRYSAMLATATLALAITALSGSALAQATTKPGPEQTNTNSNAPTTGVGSEASSPSTSQQTPSGSGASSATTESGKSATATPSTRTGANSTSTGSTGTGTTAAGAATKSNTGTSNTNAVGAGASTANAEGNKTEQDRTQDNKGSAAHTNDGSGADSSKPDETQPASTTPKAPRTEMSGTPGSDNGPHSADPLLEPGPLPANKSTLIGGTAKKVDRIRNRVTVKPFGGGKDVRVVFDERSRIYRDGRETTIMNVKPGDRVYVDTQLVGPQIFARNLRVQTNSGPAEASGQIVSYDSSRNSVRLMDKLTNQTIDFTVSQATQLKSKSGEAKLSDLRPGALVSVVFAPGKKGGEAREVDISAIPGTSYLFAGKITNLDLRNGVVALENQSDGRNYEIRFNPASVENREALGIGVEVAANSTFDGKGYIAKSLTVTKPSQPESAEQ